jgi:dTDP-glucose 4,6-dehydratase
MTNNLQADLEHIFSNIDSLWENFRNSNIFLTGGTGFFGKWLLESFIYANEQKKLNAKITVLSRAPLKFIKEFPHLANGRRVNFLKGNVIDFEFPTERFDYVIHAATEVNAKLNDQNPLEIFDIIVHGTRRVLDFAVKCKARRFLLTSSGAIYGKQPPQCINISEEYNGAPDPLNPISTYGEAKRASELLCSIYQRQHDLSFSIARCFTFVGPYLNLDIHFAVGNFIRNILNGENINISGDGSPYRSYMYTADLTIWLWTILIKGKNNEAYNVGSDKAISILELAELIKENSKDKSIIISKKGKFQKTPERYVPSIEKAKHDLGLNITIDLPEAIQRTISFHKSNYKK